MNSLLLERNRSIEEEEPVTMWSCGAVSIMREG